MTVTSPAKKTPKLEQAREQQPVEETLKLSLQKEFVDFSKRFVNASVFAGFSIEFNEKVSQKLMEVVG